MNTMTGGGFPASIHALNLNFYDNSMKLLGNLRRSEASLQLMDDLSGTANTKTKPPAFYLHAS